MTKLTSLIARTLGSYEEVTTTMMTMQVCSTSTTKVEVITATTRLVLHSFK